MAKTGSVWECQQCGAQFPKWAGKCPDCNAWTSLVETVVSPHEIKNQKSKIKNGNREQARPQKLSDILKDIDTNGQRISTGIGELDRVLGGPPSPDSASVATLALPKPSAERRSAKGAASAFGSTESASGQTESARQGGLVPGQVVLLAGEPGMGKSTLLSQVAIQLGSSLQKMGETQEIGKTVEQYNSEAVISKTVNGRTVNRRTDLPAYRPTDYRSTILPFHRSTGVLYVCGEESPSQVALRLQRLAGSRFTIHDSRLTLYPETDVDAVIAEIEKQFGYQSSVARFAGASARRVSSRLQVNRFSVNRSETDKPKTDEPETDLPAEKRAMSPVRRDEWQAEAGNRKQKTDNGIVIIDSIQTLSTADLSGLSGSVGQIRECTGRLSQVAKQLNIPLFLVGHVTKEGEVAGPKVLEHMVDTVLVMEGDRSGNLRILRSLKNRFGPVDEVGIFSMDDGGMKEVKNPAELLVGDLAAKAPGSVLGCVLEGQRPLVLEIQALAVPTKLSFPRRVGQGISERRLQLLCAVIEKHLGLGIGEKDVFVNVAGGLKSSDPGLDLPVVAAIVSSAAQKSQLKSAEIGKHQIADRSEKVGSGLSGLSAIRLSADASRSKPTFPIFCGEVGLLGEVRMVPGWPRREKEVNRLGLGKLVGKAEIGHIGELRKYLQ